MKYPIPSTDVKEEDLTKTAANLYRPLRSQGFSHEQAMQALYGLTRASGSRYVPDLTATRARAA